MNPPRLVVSIFLFLVIPLVAHGQSVARISPSTLTRQADNAGSKAFTALKQLESEAIVYRSLYDFEAGGRLARVPLKTFERQLLEAANDVEPILAKMPASKLKIELANALASYRDGVYWWSKIDQPRVIDVSALAYEERNITAADAAFLASAPYTVAINWRQAARYLARAETLLNQGEK